MSRGERKIVAIDLDNVLADTLGLWCELVQIRFKKTITKEMIPDPRLRGLRIGIRRPHLLRILREVWTHWERLPLVDKDAPLVIDHLRKRGYKVIILSSRSPEDRIYVEKWLKHNRIVVDELKFLGFSTQKKDHKEVDILIDDDAREIEEFVRMGKVGILYTQPWNKQISVRATYRVSSFQEIEEILDKLI
ncbi:hypothetical protein DRJ17_05465 [Candidatus Woesearchaeota archaeon]|nr:MAG: hypothetical protein DRJ17_05465 [Candidatus Woesearchaeota archaeon]